MLAPPDGAADNSEEDASKEEDVEESRANSWGSGSSTEGFRRRLLFFDASFLSAGLVPDDDLPAAADLSRSWLSLLLEEPELEPSSLELLESSSSLELLLLLEELELLLDEDEVLLLSEELLELDDEELLERTRFGLDLNLLLSPLFLLAALIFFLVFLFLGFFLPSFFFLLFLEAFFLAFLEVVFSLEVLPFFLSLSFSFGFFFRLSESASPSPSSPELLESSEEVLLLPELPPLVRRRGRGARCMGWCRSHTAFR